MKRGETVEKKYIAIDLKSFYASVECVELGIDPLDAYLVVADKSRTSKTICLAVSPALKAFGISGRARLFEVEQRVAEVNAARLRKTDKGEFVGYSQFDYFLKRNRNMGLDFIVATPRMAHYIKMSTEIYKIYLKYIAPEDIHVYSIDEVFIDATAYLKNYGMTAAQLAEKMVRDVFETTGITATAGIGTNLYLCKIAMDIVAKHIEADKDGIRIAELDELSYRRLLWGHRPLTDFWRIGRGYADRLAHCGIFTMGDIARCSIYNEELLYSLFGKNAELLIDHAWGYEPCTMSEIKSYRPENTSRSVGQVLSTPYDFDKARIIIREMAESLALDLLDKGLVTDQMVLSVGYDRMSLRPGSAYEGEVAEDHYGRRVPKHAHGSEKLEGFTSSGKAIVEAVLRLYDRIVDPDLLVRRMSIAANHTARESDIGERSEQLTLFCDFEAAEREREKRDEELKKERSIQNAVLGLQKRYGKNAVLKGTNFKEGATARERNRQIGGHKA